MTRQPFENLKYRIHNIPKSSDLMEDFPDLRKHEEEFSSYTVLTQEGDQIRQPLTKSQSNSLIRYLIYLYDPKSDLIRQEPDLQDRKKKASELSGFTEYQQPWVLDKAFYFLTRVFNNRKFREWCILQQELEEKDKARMKPINEDDTKDQKQLMEAYEKKGKLLQQSQVIHKALDAIEGEVFGDNADLKDKANDMMLTTPEKVAFAYN